MALFTLHNNTPHHPLPILPFLPSYHLALPSSPRRVRVMATMTICIQQEEPGFRKSEIRKCEKKNVNKGFDSDRRGVMLVADETHISGGECFISHLSLASFSSRFSKYEAGS